MQKKIMKNKKKLPKMARDRHMGLSEEEINKKRKYAKNTYRDLSKND